MATTIGKLAVMLSLNSKAYSSGLSKAATKSESTIGRITKSISKISVATAATAAAATAVAIPALTKQQMGLIDATAKTADALGLGTEQLVGYRHAAGLAGVSNEALTTGFRRLQKNVSDATLGLTTSSRAFDALGLSAESIKRLSPDEQIKAIADAFPRLTNQADRARVAQDLFGRSGLDLIKLLEQGSAGLSAAQREAAALGLTFNRLDAAKVERANDSISKLSAGIKAIGLSLAIGVSDPLAKIATLWTDNWKRIQAGVTAAVSRTVDVVVAAGRVYVKAVTTTAAAIAPVVIALGRTFISVGRLARDALAAGLNAVGQVVGPVGERLASLGNLFNKWRDTVSIAFITAEFAARHWRDTFEYGVVSATAKLLSLGGEIKHLFGTVAPRLMGWFADNWKEILITIGANTLTFFENLTSNIVNIVKAIPDLIAGNLDLSDVWQPLSDGFLNVIKELPDIPDRQIGELEKLFKSQSARMGKALAGDLDMFVLERFNSIKNQTSKLQGFFDSAINFNLPDLAEIPSLDLADSAKSMIEAGIGLDNTTAAIERGTVEAYSAERMGREQRQIERHTRGTQRNTQVIKEEVRNLVGVYRDAARNPAEIVSIL
jgi:hypothetical protein